MNLKTILLSERNCTKRPTARRIPFTGNANCCPGQKAQQWLPREVGRGEEEWVGMSTISTVVVLRTYVQGHQIVCFKYVPLAVCQ